jgi:hypothetical protein
MMTDRYNALLVVLESDVREDDLAALVQAISQFRGVISVKPRGRTDHHHVIARMQERNEIRKKLWQVLNDE